MKMSTLEFQIPDFLQIDEEEIHQRMLQQAPRNYDVSEGSLFFDATIATAMEKSKMIGFNLVLTLQMMFPQFAEDIFLDYHGESFKLPRHPAIKAIGVVKIQGEEGVLIPKGTIVMTAGTENDIPVRYITTEDVRINELGEVEAPIEAVEAGRMGNVPSDSIVLLDSSINGVYSINNETPTINGEEKEDDEHYRDRILERRQKQSLSGAKRDYIAWAKEVEGVGEVIPLPEWNGPGTVKVLITARNGGIASQELIDNVQQHIAPDGREGGGLAPIGAFVTVDTVAQLVIDLSFESLELEEGVNESDAIELIKEQLTNYFNVISIGGLIRFAHIGSIIINSKGVKDYEGLLINNSDNNIQLDEGVIAVVGEVIYT